MRVTVTGHRGLVGLHVRAALMAANSAADYHGRERPFEVRLAGREEFSDAAALADAVSGADAVVHLAAVNRPGDGESHADNEALAQSLVKALNDSGTRPQIIYSNSVRAERPGADEYGRAKAKAGAILAAEASGHGAPYTDLILPHVFGEGGRPHHNTVVSTICSNAANGVPIEIRDGASVELVHAGSVAGLVVDALTNRASGRREVEGRVIGVSEVDATVRRFRDEYRSGVIPDVSGAFERDLFNTYRWYESPAREPGSLTMNEDVRGSLFEAVKGGGGGQVFLSWTKPGVTRGDHFHLRKIERFLVLEGEAVIRYRSIFESTVHEYEVSGSAPAYVDMPTMYAHSIENVGSDDLLTLFWAHEIFDPNEPDTYAMSVSEFPGA